MLHSGPRSYMLAVEFRAIGRSNTVEHFISFLIMRFFLP